MSDTATAPTEAPIDTTPGTFAWNELATSDVAGSVDFYSQLFGWEIEECPETDGYKMFKVGERYVGGVMDKSGQCDGPPLWISYVYVDDVVTSLAKAVELGASEFKGATEIPGKGSFAIIQDPQGGMLAFWQASGEGC